MPAVTGGRSRKGRGFLLKKLDETVVGVDFRELAVTAGADVAFAVAIMWCGPDSSANPVDKDGFRTDPVRSKRVLRGLGNTDFSRGRQVERRFSVDIL